MPKKTDVKDYRYEEKRKNNPPAGLAEYEPRLKHRKSKHYAYDPYESPQLVWAGKPGLTAIDIEQDTAGVEADTVSLHVHERVSAKAIVKTLERELPQIDLFATPKLSFNESVKFYQYDVDWSNRLILGDSLLVANSMIQNEMMAGKVQMIYVDPPYGVKYASNFQAKINERQVKEEDDSLTREPEQIKAYRDTWELGIHSYLTYLRDRLRVCKDLLTESGSIFVQISDENVHLVRCLMDEVFGRENFLVSIIIKKKSITTITNPVNDYLLWYIKNKEQVKIRKLTILKSPFDEDARFKHVEFPGGQRKAASQCTQEELNKTGVRYLNDDYPLVSQDESENRSSVFIFEGRELRPGKGRHWTYDPDLGMRRLAIAARIRAAENTARGVVFFDDFGRSPLTNLWEFHGERDQVYVVQTNRSIIERCLLMTTDPGDLVFDPTCGSGTTAYVAEQWGRRWITCDTSRVALSIARQRLLTATYPYYVIKDAKDDPGCGFRYKTVPHITLKSIANNTRIDDVAARFNPKIEEALNALNTAAKTSFQEWEVPFEPDEKWNKSAMTQFKAFRQLKQEKQQTIDKIITENAEPEILYDQPEEDKKIVRVSGPFTVESIAPPIEDYELPDPETPEVAESLSEDNHIPYLISLMQKDGVTFPDNKKMKFDELSACSGGILHAEGHAGGRRVAVSFGPLHGSISGIQVLDGLREANIGGYDDVIFCGFAFEPEAHAIIAEDTHPKVKANASHIRPDILLTDSEGKSLLKTTSSSQLFSVFGEPDIELIEKNGEYVIKLVGVDVYDPIDGTVHSENAGRVAAWFADTDYDGQTFYVMQAFFPDKSAWNKIERALKGSLDKERFDLLTGQTSLPFTAGKHKRAAVKVIDPRGNEVMKVIKL